jgi:uncharacterized protein (TIGR02217 family)
MVEFHDVLFPKDVSRGARGGPQFQTRVITTNSGYESRTAEWSTVRGRWNVGYGVRNDADLDELLAFFYARRGRAHSFRFRDPVDNRAVGQALQTNAQGAVQLAKLYTSGGTTYTRFITLPVAGTITGIPEGDVNLTTGIVTGHAAGTIVSFKYDCKCRFDTDYLDGEVLRDGAVGYADIPVIEVR